ncbi:MAG: hypothetical protein LRY36_00770 [Alphaproteobacteria bacterium]|nr:hypothetical protein [Alphaproteobacteria bacterium]
MGPFILFDAKGIIYDGDAAWSRNAALEKAIGNAIQYGVPLPGLVRRGEDFETPDIKGRPVSIVDQAWEDARHLVYEVKKRKYAGQEYETRSEPAAALLLIRFMNDLKWRNDVPLEQGGLDKSRASQVVKDHYASPEEMAKFDRLRALMLPFLAKDVTGLRYMKY